MTDVMLINIGDKGTFVASGYTIVSFVLEDH